MKPAVSTLAADLAAPRVSKWRVNLRDEKSGQILPVMVPESDTEHAAISDAMNRVARLFKGSERDWKPETAHRCL